MEHDASDHEIWSATQQRLGELLLESRCSESFSEDHQRELNDLLRADEDNREFAAQFLLDGDTIAELLATAAVAESAISPPLRPAAEARKRRNWRRAIPWLGAVAALVLIAPLVYLFFTADRTPVAVVRSESDAVFADGARPQNGRFEKKTYSLVSGTVAVQLRNEVSMTVDGPATFEIKDASCVSLTAGNMRAEVPRAGRGFTVETPAANIVDLGTEFTVAVDAETGECQVQVVTGRVEVNHPRDGTTIVELSRGQSTRVRDGKVVADARPTEPGVSYSEWRESSEALRKDKDLFFYFDFAKSGEGDDVLQDMDSQEPRVNGDIMDAQWVEGRWPEKSALQFADDGNVIRLDLGHQLKQFSFAAWVNVDRLDRDLTPVFSSVERISGHINLAISRNRKTFIANLDDRSQHEYSEVQLPLGRWVLLAATVDAEQQAAITYINGEVAARTALPEGVTPTFSACMLGGRLFFEDGEIRHEGFLGRIDEIAVWKRTLESAEIKQMYETGRPAVPASDSR